MTIRYERMIRVRTASAKQPHEAHSPGWWLVNLYCIFFKCSNEKWKLRNERSRNILPYKTTLNSLLVVLVAVSGGPFGKRLAACIEKHAYGSYILGSGTTCNLQFAIFNYWRSVLTWRRVSCRSLTTQRAGASKEKKEAISRWPIENGL